KRYRPSGGGKVRYRFSLNENAVGGGIPVGDSTYNSHQAGTARFMTTREVDAPLVPAHPELDGEIAASQAGNRANRYPRPASGHERAIAGDQPGKLVGIEPSQGVKAIATMARRIMRGAGVRKAEPSGWVQCRK